jgi:predicted ribosomally synthesized peptide with nif11-like leader
MSIENVKQFYQVLATDEELKANLTELMKPYQGLEMNEGNRIELAEKILLPIAAEKGMAFTVEDLHQYEREVSQKNQTGELSDEEMEAVAGGLGIAFALCIIIGFGAGVHTGFCWITGLY